MAKAPAPPAEDLADEDGQVVPEMDDGQMIACGMHLTCMLAMWIVAKERKTKVNREEFLSDLEGMAEMLRVNIQSRRDRAEETT